MDMKLIFIFAVAALFETVTPGPSMALVVESRASAGRRGAFITVLGITLANIAWVGCVILPLWFGSKWFAQWLVPVIRYLGTAYLIYLASRRMLSAVVQFITHRDDLQIVQRSRSHIFWAGFFAHAGNPLSIGYYLATFGVIVMGMSFAHATLYGLVPVVIDFVVFALLAMVVFGKARNFAGRWARLLAGLFLFYLVGHVYSKSPTVDLGISVTPLTTLIMLAGFFWAAIAESRAEVLLREGKNNKLLWRAVGLWGVWFSVAALFGGLYTLIGGFGVSAFSLDAVYEHRLRICFVVAAVIGSTLSLAKACGELQDDQSAQDLTLPAITPICWQTTPRSVGAFTFATLVAVYVLLTVTGFSVQ